MIAVMVSLSHVETKTKSTNDVIAIKRALEEKK